MVYFIDFGFGCVGNGMIVYYFVDGCVFVYGIVVFGNNFDDFLEG